MIQTIKVMLFQQQRHDYVQMEILHYFNEMHRHIREHGSVSLQLGQICVLHENVDVAMEVLIRDRMKSATMVTQSMTTHVQIHVPKNLILQPQQGDEGLQGEVHRDDEDLQDEVHQDDDEGNDRLLSVEMERLILVNSVMNDH